LPGMVKLGSVLIVMGSIPSTTTTLIVVSAGL
jgi:hypothetical protein